MLHWSVTYAFWKRSLFVKCLREKKDRVVLKQGVDVTKSWDFSASLAIFRIDLESGETNIGFMFSFNLPHLQPKV